MARFEDPFKEDEETAGFYELLSKLTGDQVERVERRRVKIRSDFFSPPMSANKIGRDEIVLLSLRTLGNISRSFIVSTADTEEDLRGEEGGGKAYRTFPSSIRRLLSARFDSVSLRREGGGGGGGGRRAGRNHQGVTSRRSSPTEGRDARVLTKGTPELFTTSSSPYLSSSLPGSLSVALRV